MEAYIQISWLNDFIFCPRSIYFHQLYGGMSTKTYHSSVQTKGLNAHKSVDEQSYSTSAHVLQGTEVYTEQYKLAGKIDVFDIKKKQLTERKKRIKTIYDGYVFQVYAHYFALQEMGYEVETIRFYSKDDNKVYPIKTPDKDKQMFRKFEATVDALNNYKLQSNFIQNPEKCANCIYINLCDCASC